MLDGILAGELALPTGDTVEPCVEALGRPATDFSAHIRKTIESSAWATPSDQSS